MFLRWSSKLRNNKSMSLYQRLKQKFCFYRSIDRCGPDPGGQAIFYGGHKTTVLNSALLL